MSWMSFRYRSAFWFGRKEHFFSRVLFVCLLATLAVFYLSKPNVLKIMLFIDIGLWVLYWLSHRMEKAFHPKH